MFYETTFLISLNIDQSKIFDVWAEIMEKVKAAGLSIQKDNKPYARSLSYPIAKQRKAYVATLFMEEGEGVAKKIQEIVAGREEIIRHLTTSIAHLPKPRLVTRPVMKTQKEEAERETKRSRDMAEVQKSSQGQATIEEVDKKLQEILDDKLSF